MNNLVRHGISLNVFGEEEKFNVVVFLVADLSFVKEVLGRCSSSHTFGCFHCDLKIQSWSHPVKKTGNPHTIEKMKERGVKALCDLGDSPSKGSSQYKKFTMNNYAQWVSYLLYIIYIQ